MSEPMRFDPREAVERVLGAPSTDVFRCPRCGAPEVNPLEENQVFIRAYKVDTQSECLVCASSADLGGNGYDENLVWNGGTRPKPCIPGYGWFDDDGAGAAVIIKG